MSDLTTPAASSIALPASAAPPSVNAPGSSNQRGFCQVMNDKQFKPRAKAPEGEEKGQSDAATGKDLPEKDKSVDPALAWLFGAPSIVLPVPTPAPTPPVATTTELPATLEGAPDIAPDVLMASGGSDVKPQAIEPQGICDVDVVKPRMLTLPVATPTNQPDAAPQPIKLPLLQPQLPADRAANAQPIAAALPALFALAMASERGKRDEDPMPSPTPAATPLSQATATMPVAPMGDAQRQTLDLGRQDWPQKMIDHIEALRDNANANDTSIRLKPEALGRVDIALRTHDSGAISVRFTAEQPTTRTLLVDAAPQLAAAAEARGIRLSGTSVDLSGQGDQRPHPQAERTQPIINRLATERGDDNQAVDDGRIA
jgi:flagellar hook-length control protein FliK